MYVSTNLTRFSTPRKSTGCCIRTTTVMERRRGVPSIRGLPIPVATVVDMVADGRATGEILRASPDLDEAEIREALRCAAEAVRERELPLLPVR